MLRAVVGLLASLPIVATAQTEPPTKAAPAPAAVAPAPPRCQTERHKVGKIEYRLFVKPCAPKPGAAMEIEAELSEILEFPDPTWGTRKPLADADLRAILVNVDDAKPAKAKKVKKSAPVRLGRAAVRLGDPGRYGFTFSADEGVYAVHLRGTSKTAGAISGGTVVSFGVWPLPEGFDRNNPPPLTGDEPALEIGDMQNGRNICAERCRTDLPAALPKGKPPTFLRSDFAAGLSDDELIKAVLNEGPKLYSLERNDLLYYLRSLHWGVREFYPEASTMVSKQFTINEHGQKRLNETLGTSFAADELTARVFVPYQVEGEVPPMVDYDDRVTRDRLKRSAKLGYLLFLSIPKEQKAYELALALGREPTYEILGIAARDASGARDAATNKQLQSFVGKGQFNNAKSLAKGAAAFEKRLVPIYLRAAELATTFYTEEREFTEFDAEFEGGEDTSLQAGEMKFTKDKKKK